ncbi:class I SAM-dependent methyltransferase [Agromyces protaetiae]|uniref:Class I SAM-dependent methyltransferase n=1 Tax=Agromyces protaetiae TaxID=2509455 RepID=A0A4P6F864_9MICO|nr:class I SAM-dependent methyltransferase [Agromyces protaetiae]QAY72012.1 class I SAM-dependent methyltransferase [Agromyces protaetiae]
MTATTTITRTDADRELKARHRSMWASGDYPTLASDLIWSLGSRLVEATGVQAGDRVLDVAAGSGNAAIPAALRGADVVASDLAPELFAAGRARAGEAGARLEWREADAEDLPFEDAAFDAAVSCVGMMFAPHHERSAAELVRVVRPGGRFGVLSWTPEGFIGRMFRTMKPYAPPLPEGAQPAPLWGDESHVRGLLGDAVDDVVAVRETIAIDRFGSGAEFRDYFKTHYGPTIAVYTRIADDPAAVAELDDALADLGDEALGDDGRAMHWQYLLVTATKR